MPQDISEFAQSYLRGADSYQIRDMLYDLVRHWVSKSQVSSEETENTLNQVMRTVDRVFLNPMSLKGSREEKMKQTNMEYSSRTLFNSLLDRSDPQSSEEAQDMYDNLVQSVKQYALNELPLYQLELSDAHDLARTMVNLKNFSDKNDNPKVFYEPQEDGQYEFFVATEQSELSLGFFPMDNSNEADMASKRLQTSVDELQSIKGKTDRESVTQRIRIRSSNPIGLIPESSKDSAKPSQIDIQKDVQIKANRADMVLSRSMAELNKLIEEIRDTSIAAKQVAPTVNLSSLLTILTEVIGDLSQSSTAFSELVQGRGTLNLSQFGKWQASWKTIRQASDMNEYASVVRSIIGRIQQVLADMVQNIQHDTELDPQSLTAAITGSWLRQAAAPMALSPDAIQEEPVSQSEQTQVQKTEESDDERMFSWEVSLAIGAANRTIKVLDGLLGDSSFWHQFELPSEAVQLDQNPETTLL